MDFSISRNDELLFEGKRKRLVEQLKEKGITNQAVLNAILKIPRHFFLDQDTILQKPQHVKLIERPALLEHAYSDKALKIGAGQTISHPFTVAFQTEKLNIQKGDKVLEIGTGCGYQTAVLLEMGAKVYSIERQKELFDKTKLFLPKMGYQLAKLMYGDGYKGWPQYAPFDKIIVTAAAPYIPQDLLAQLVIGGILVIPLGEGEEQVMNVIVKKTDKEFEKQSFGKFKFVPMLQNKAS